MTSLDRTIYRHANRSIFVASKQRELFISSIANVPDGMLTFFQNLTQLTPQEFTEIVIASLPYTACNATGAPCVLAVSKCSGPREMV